MIVFFKKTIAVEKNRFWKKICRQVIMLTIFNEGSSLKIELTKGCRYNDR